MAKSEYASLKKKIDDDYKKKLDALNVLFPQNDADALFTSKPSGKNLIRDLNTGVKAAAKKLFEIENLLIDFMGSVDKIDGEEIKFTAMSFMNWMIRKEDSPKSVSVNTVIRALKSLEKSGFVEVVSKQTLDAPAVFKAARHKPNLAHALSPEASQ